MELGTSALGAIAAVAGATSAIGFNLVHPMLAEYNSTERARTRWAVHFKVGKTVKLLAFGGFPDGPGFQVAEFAAGEGAESAFGGAAGSRGEGMKKEF
jgi:hypothetical protein